MELIQSEEERYNIEIENNRIISYYDNEAEKQLFTYEIGNNLIRFLEADTNTLRNSVSKYLNALLNDTSHMSIEEFSQYLKDLLSNIHPALVLYCKAAPATIQEVLMRMHISNSNKTKISKESFIKNALKIEKLYAHSPDYNRYSMPELEMNYKFEVQADGNKKENQYIINSLFPDIESCQKHMNIMLEWILDLDYPAANQLSINERIILYNIYHSGALNEYTEVKTRQYIPPNGIITFFGKSAIVDIIRDNVNIKDMVSCLTFEKILLLEFMRMVENNIMVRKCKNCGKFFIPVNRSDELYCSRTTDDKNRTCKDVGAINKYFAKINSNPILKAYNTAYKTHNARIRSGAMSKEEFSKWTIKAKILRDKCLEGDITLEEFTAYLKK